MTTNLKQVSGSLRLRGMLCVFFFIAAGFVVLAGIASSSAIAKVDRLLPKTMAKESLEAQISAPKGLESQSADALRSRRGDRSTSRSRRG